MEPKVKNKAVAPLQISAEQILLEAYERREQTIKAPQQKILDSEELREFQGRKRTEFENGIRRNKVNTRQWLRYAQFEIDQKEYARARSLFERALTEHPEAIEIWLRYIQTELKERNVNHARNVLDRSVTHLPRVDKLWYTYVMVEETLDNINGCRQVFERWMKWRPDSGAWGAYINMEKRHGNIERARSIFERFTVVHPSADNWVKWARFEEESGTPSDVRQVYENAVEIAMAQGIESVDEKLLVNWTKWETRQREFERARAIYKMFLEQLPASKAKKLYNEYTRFEKQFGDKDGIEDVILSKRRKEYELRLQEDPRDYDSWFSYLGLLEETSATEDAIREVYERAISNYPEEMAKDAWRRYIYLWIRYAVYEELTTNDTERARQVYQQCLKLVPHKIFTFGKLWLLYAKFELRQGDLPLARKILGRGLGVSGGKPSIFKGYIELERKLKEFDRCRKLYEKYLETYPEQPNGWVEYGTLEQELGDEERARGIYEIAISQSQMAKPEMVWKRYIEFEAEEGNYDLARKLFERLLSKTGNVKVWISYAMFELTVDYSDDNEEEEEEEEVQVTEQNITEARKVFERAWEELKKSKQESRVILHDAWMQFEERYGNAETQEQVAKHKPLLTKKRRKLEDGSFEEYMDYIFPTDEQAQKVSKFLQMARKWRQEKS
ncbi:pre-mRNA-splicing factor Clf1p [Trichomonascus vanleenenianus]|uniref:Clf1p n=1 Tax=Trichomonascus vanleenenianus TaxID=2268995 RepID=UPI003ECABE68